MAISAGEIEAVLRLRDEMSAKLKDVSAAATTMGGTLTKVGAGMTLGITAPIFAVGGAAIKMAMETVESENLVAVSFGDMAAAANAWSGELSKSLGLNEFELRKQAGTLFNMTTSMGLSKQAAFDMSTGVVKLAADMASFRNIPIAEALLKIKSGLVGQTEPLQAIGILTDANTIKTYAYKEGIAKQGAELTAQQKIMARWAAILGQTANDQGDLARTIDSPTNKLRVMGEQVRQLTVDFGSALLPTIQVVITAISALTPKLGAAVQWFAALPAPVKTAAVILAALLAAIGPLITAVGGLALAVGALASPAAIGALAIGLSLMSGALGVVLGPIGLVAAALVGVTVALGYFGVLDDVIALFKDLYVIISTLVLGVLSHVVEVAKAVGSALLALGGWVAGLVLTFPPLTFVIDNVVKGLQLLRVGIGATAALIDDKSVPAFAQAEKGIEKYRKQVVDTGALVPTFDDALRHLAEMTLPAATDGFDGLTSTVTAAETELRALSKTQRDDLTKALKSGALTQEEIAEKTGLTSAAIKVFKDRIADAAKTMNASKEEFDKNSEAVHKLESGFYGLSAAVSDVGKYDLELLREQIKVREEIDKIEQTAHIAQFGYKGMADGLDQLTGTTAVNSAAVEAWAKSMAFTGPTLDMVQQKSTSFSEFLKADFGPTLIAAFQGGGDAIKSMAGKIGTYFTTGGEGGSKFGQGLEKMFASGGAATKVFGDTIGGLIGSVIPGLGAVLGPVVGLFGKLFDDPEKKINPIREAFVQMHGGLDALNVKAAAAGVTLAALLDAKNPKAYEQAIKDLNAAFEFQAKSMQTLEDTAKKYGLSLEELGPAWARAELDKKAQELFRDFKVLTAGGVDIDVVITKMGQSMNAFVVEALKTGSEIPAAMAPMLQRMVELGLLVDKDGKAITNLDDAGIKFSETMTEGFSRVVAEVQKLTEAIARGLGLSLDDTIKKIGKIPAKIPVEIHYRETGDVPDAPEAPEAPEGFAHGSGGLRNFGRGTRAILHGKEAVLTEGQFNHRTSGGGTDGLLLSELRGLRSAIENMPYLMEKRARDGHLLGTATA